MQSKKRRIGSKFQTVGAAWRNCVGQAVFYPDRRARWYKRPTSGSVQNHLQPTADLNKIERHSAPVLSRFDESISATHDKCYIDINFFGLHPSLRYLLVSWAWWDWPLTWLTNNRPSVLWHCWLGHVTRKIVSEMTYNVSSGTLNSTILHDRNRTEIEN